MAKPKKGQLHQVLFPLVDKTDFASIESAVTSGLTCKFYGVNHGGSAAMTSGTVSKTASVVHSGIFRLCLKSTENNYDNMLLRVAHASCADQILTWENADYDDSDLYSQASDLASDLRSYLVGLSASLSDVDSALTSQYTAGHPLTASDLSDLRSAIAAGPAATITASDISDIASAVDTILASRLSDILSAAQQTNSRALVVQSLVSDVDSALTSQFTAGHPLNASDLSDIRSAVLSLSAMLSDAHSAAAQANSRAFVVQSSVSDVYSAVARHDANMVMRRNAVAGGAAATITLDAGAGATNSLYNDMTIAVIAGTGVGQVRSINNYVGATKIATVSPNWETTPVAGDSFVLLTNRTDHSHLEDTYSLLSDLQSDFQSRVPKAVATNSQLSDLASDLRSYLVGISGMLSDVDSALTSQYTAGHPLTASDLSDLRSAIIAGPTDVTIGASSMSDIRSAITAASSDIKSQATANHSDLKSAIGNVSVSLTASDISDIASAVAASGGLTASQVWTYATRKLTSLADVSLCASDLSDIRSAITAGPTSVTLGASSISDIRSAITAGTSDIKSQITAGVPISASDMSDLRSAITAGPTDVQLNASSLSDLRSAITAGGGGGATASAVWAYATRKLTSMADVSLCASDLSDIRSAITAGPTDVQLNASSLSDLRSAITAGGGGGATASQVWTYATRTLTSLPDVSLCASDLSDLRSAITAGPTSVTLGASSLSDIRSAITAASSDIKSQATANHSDLKSAIGNVSVTLTASDISDIASGVVAGGLLTASQVWNFSARTLTQTAAAVASVMAGSTITVQRGDTTTISLTGLGNVSSRTKLWFTAKRDREDSDGAAMILATEAGGLTTINGRAPATGETCTITVTNATTGAVTILLSAAATKTLPLIANGSYDLQMQTATSVTTLTDATFEVAPDVTQATS